MTREDMMVEVKEYIQGKVHFTYEHLQEHIFGKRIKKVYEIQMMDRCLLTLIHKGQINPVLTVDEHLSYFVNDFNTKLL